ncbi:DivIVA domain-containing protein [Diaminobutyricibacter sp. McL0608]|uniref:DivIVA domain-containing protein n=1 Tax=Leifsonia sp. McL0608 TaxID=3143537 RepID=UPI0031F2E478
MALTPEDVVNKRFQPTKFREGYDQDEVDDFLDEVVVELRRLNQENEELKQRLVASDSRIAELQRSGAQAAQAAPAAPEQPATVAAPVVAAAATPVAAAYAAPTPVDANAVDPSSTNNLLQLARRLHEEHVREGIEKRDALIAEGHATAARVVAEAESKQRAQISQLDQERALLEHRIDELRTFEREYRQQLRSYIESQLRDLETSSVSGTGSYAAPAQASQSPASGQVPVVASAPAPALPAANEGSQESAPQPPTFQGFGG